MAQGVWKLQDAKNRFSEVVEKSLHEGPQIIERRGKPTSVLLSFEEYQKKKSKKKSLLEIGREFAGLGDELDITRDKSPDRKIDFGEDF